MKQQGAQWKENKDSEDMNDNEIIWMKEANKYCIV